MPCTSLCSSGGRLMRRTSPCTRIIGGRPDERCKSEALFLTENASNSEMSIYNPCAVNGRMPLLCAFFALNDLPELPAENDYVHNRLQLASCRCEYSRRCHCRWPPPRPGDAAGSFQNLPGRSGAGGDCGRSAGFWRELFAGS